MARLAVAPLKDEWRSCCTTWMNGSLQLHDSDDADSDDAVGESEAESGFGTPPPPLSLPSLRGSATADLHSRFDQQRGFDQPQVKVRLGHQVTHAAVFQQGEDAGRRWNSAARSPSDKLRHSNREKTLEETRKTLQAPRKLQKCWKTEEEARAVQ